MTICHHHAAGRGTGAAKSAASRAAQQFADKTVRPLRSARVVVAIIALSMSGCASATIAWRSTVTVNQGGYATGAPSNRTEGGGNVKATVTP